MINFWSGVKNVCNIEYLVTQPGAQETQDGVMGPAASHTGQAYEDLEIIRAFRQGPLVKKVTVLMREMDVLKHILIYDVYCIYCIYIGVYTYHLSEWFQM